MKAAFTCSYGLAGRPQIMEMNFPHDLPIEGNSTPVSLRKLDMDILRVLAFSASPAPVVPTVVTPSPSDRQACLMALFAGTGRADRLSRGSFNPPVARALSHWSQAEQQSEIGVYHYGSVNRKAARLLRSHAEKFTSQAF